MSVPVLSRLLVDCRTDRARGAPGPSCKPPRGPARRPNTVARAPKRDARPHRPASPVRASARSPTDPALRANPFPEVTDPFCRLPLPTLFYQLEAVHLGDLMRLSVRPGATITHSLGFSRAVEGAPDATKSVALYRTRNPISSQPDSRVSAR